MRMITVAITRFLAAMLALSFVTFPGVGNGFAQTPKRGGTLNVGLHIDLLHYDWQPRSRIRFRT